ncbi:hypothetical protein ABTN25_19445, partial [Acinetobacter baumannii]
MSSNALAPTAEQARALLPHLWAEDERPGKAASPRLLRRLLQAVAGLFAILVLLAAIVPIGGAVIGAGQVGVESKVKRIAHPSGGVIK